MIRFIIKAMHGGGPHARRNTSTLQTIDRRPTDQPPAGRAALGRLEPPAHGGT
jgi:hypothetical protein